MGTQKGQKVPIGDLGPQLGTPLGAVRLEVGAFLGVINLTHALLLTTTGRNALACR